MIKYLGQRPVVVDNFGEDVEGDGYRFQVRVYGADPNTALEGLDDRRIRYVVVPMSKWSFLSDDPDETSLLKQLAGFGKKPLTEGKRLELPLPDLERFRLTFESSVVTRAGLRIQPPYRVYEVVPGARIRGSAAPGTDVQLTLRFASSAGRGLRYVRHAIADANGEYALRVPYPTTSESSDVRPLGPYRVQSRGHERVLVIPEAAVREGREVTGPDLR
jgi:asparagine N-glycosylation enzyme membrane subunit Stt3